MQKAYRFENCTKRAIVLYNKLKAVDSHSYLFSADGVLTNEMQCAYTNTTLALGLSITNTPPSKEGKR